MCNGMGEKSMTGWLRSMTDRVVFPPSAEMPRKGVVRAGALGGRRFRIAGPYGFAGRILPPCPQLGCCQLLARVVMPRLDGQPANPSPFAWPGSNAI